MNPSPSLRVRDSMELISRFHLIPRFLRGATTAPTHGRPEPPPFFTVQCGYAAKGGTVKGD